MKRTHTQKLRQQNAKSKKQKRTENMKRREIRRNGNIFVPLNDRAEFKSTEKC